MVVVEAGAHSRKRLRRTPEEKRRIVEATFAPGASIARVAREHGVNANQVFQWRYEYRKGTLGVRQQGQTVAFRITWRNVSQLFGVVSALRRNASQTVA